ncbi:hypothetical protein R3P38DRAFT_3174048 [Favolaschia claudopus]|uniref:Uncharacterized protein n=1 Tax=Favolaschia claudopus TaxID=2862362 RepID=A0AAW0DGR3_9AGAR
MSTPEIPQGLLVVHGDSASDVASERLNVADIVSSRCYKAIDGKQPEWIGIHETASPIDLQSKSTPEWLAIENAYYIPFATRSHPNTQPSDLPGDFLYISYMDIVPETEEVFNEWYIGEHVDNYMQVPGWLRVRRYVSMLTGGGDDSDATVMGERELLRHKYLALHEWRHAEFAESPEFHRVATTGRANEMKGAILRIEMRVFELQR